MSRGKVILLFYFMEELVPQARIGKIKFPSFLKIFMLLLPIVEGMGNLITQLIISVIN
ncbi:MAG: hypothetical protein ACFFCV_03195 [Promethearchaeota archaeon]